MEKNGQDGKTRFVTLPRWIVEAIFAILLVTTTTGVIAINVRFGSIEKNDAVQDKEIETIEKWITHREQVDIWTKEDHRQWVKDFNDLMASKEWTRQNFQPKK